MKKSININRFLQKKQLIPIGFFLASLCLWQILTRVFNIPEYILPSPTAIILALFEDKLILLNHTIITTFEAVVGLIIAFFFGILIAFVMNRFKTAADILNPFLVVSQTVPIIALAPLILIWLGVGIVPKIAIVVLVCFFPICVNTFTGLKGVEPEMINLLKVMGASKFTIFREVSLPFALPQIFSGLKIAATYSIMGAVIGEWLGAKSGLGIYMTLVSRSFETSKLFAAIIVIVLLSLLIYSLTELLAYILMPWSRHKFKEDLF